MTDDLMTANFLCTWCKIILLFLLVNQKLFVFLSAETYYNIINPTIKE